MTRQVAVVTGGGAGIGLELARSFGEAGYDVAICDLDPAPSAAAYASLTDRGIAPFYARVDVGRSAEVRAFHADLAAHFGRPATVLINNAGIQTWAHLLDLREEDWDRVLRTNLTGAFLNIQIAARAMVAAQLPGAIISIGSGANRHAFPRLVDYAASKGGLEMLTRSAAVELGSYGIRVNCIAPGGIATERTRVETADYAGEWSAITPLGRVGQPRDVASAALFLASDAASFITGETLFVDGGVFTKPNWPYPELPRSAEFRP